MPPMPPPIMATLQAFGLGDVEDVVLGTEDMARYLICRIISFTGRVP